jgi:hypothetical protein
MAKNYGVNYMECSAKSGENVEVVFSSLARKMKGKFIDEVTCEELNHPQPFDLDSQKTVR